MLGPRFIGLGLMFIGSLALYVILLFRLIRSDEDQKFNKTLQCPCEVRPVSSGRIVNGSNVSAGDLNWIVSIFVRGQSLETSKLMYQNFCTGSLINPVYILSASHCLEVLEEFLSISFVASGLDHDLINIFYYKSNYRKIYNYFYHPRFKITKSNLRIFDIGLIMVSEPFEFGTKTNIQPACFFDKNLKNFNDYKLKAAGYGDIKPRTKEKTEESYNLQPLFNFRSKVDENGKLNLTHRISKSEILNNSTELMQIEYEPIFQMNPNQKGFFDKNKIKAYDFIFVRSTVGSVCVGDSGGPLIIRRREQKNHTRTEHWVIGLLNVGISSTGNRSYETYCMAKSTAVYIPIYPFLDWITDYVGDNICVDNSDRFRSKLKSQTSVLVAIVILTFPFSFILLPYLMYKSLENNGKPTRSNSSRSS